MQLSRVIVKNYRSIKDLEICIDPKCLFLVGLNESGKTNIIKAMALLQKDALPSLEDIRFPFKRESPIQEAHVKFYFQLSDTEVERVKTVLTKKFKSESNPKIAKKGDLEISLDDFVKLKPEVVHIVDIKAQTKSNRYVTPTDKHKIVTGWKKPATSCPDDFVVDDPTTSASFRLKDYNAIFATDYPTIPENLLEPFLLSDLNSLIGQEELNIFNEQLPSCVLWRFEEAFLLPSNIDIPKFRSNPQSCIPLKLLFNLAGHTDIDKAFLEAENQPPVGVRNLLDSISDVATEHIRSIWKDYPDVEIRLEPNGPNTFDINIKDQHNRFDINRRSDGFKRFVTFLLLISAQVKTQELTNTLILIDEPEIGLHPSGVKYLRDELINISKNNTVVASTHSIYMIDSSCIERHLIVKKSKEATTCGQADESNWVDEEVLYNALGCSIFDGIGKYNIIFEGWTDKEVFKKFLANIPTELEDIKPAISKLNFIHARGVKLLEAISKTLEFGSRKHFILSDSDAPAQEAKHAYTGTASWTFYADHTPGHEITTLEDFYTAQYRSDIYLQIADLDTRAPNILAAEFPTSPNFIENLKRKLREVGVPPQDIKDIIRSFKQKAAEMVEPSSLNEGYPIFVRNYATSITREVN